MESITDKHEIEQIQAELLPRLINDWALISAGAPNDYNTMTIAWGSMGNLWWQPVVDVYVVPTRHTYKYLQDNDAFTVSFFPAEYHQDLQVLGTKSGRDGDKVALTRLTPVEIDGCVTFAEADTTLVCKKIYTQPLDAHTIPEFAMEAHYQSMEPHDLFIGQIIKAIR